MKTAIELCILIILVSIIGLIVGLKLLPADNTFNQVVRPVFLRSPTLKSLAGLNQASDNRYLYVSPDYQEVLVEIDYSSHITPPAGLSDWIEDAIRKTTDKSVIITSARTNRIPLGTLTEEELHAVAADTQNVDPDSKQNYLHLILADSSAAAPTNSGWVLNHTTIIIFHQVIMSLSDQPNIRDQLYHSTFKHEWGHLLGFKHLPQENCIMSETVEVFPHKSYQAKNLPLKYCSDTLAYLEILKR